MSAEPAFAAADLSALAAPADAAAPRRRAWVFIARADQTRAIGAALQAAGWDVSETASEFGVARTLVTEAQQLPDLLVCSLRFDDGDAFQLMRKLARRGSAPALFIASHQQRAVIKAAVALADACGLHVAGVAEQPVEAAAIVRALIDFAPRGAPSPRAAPPRPLARDELLSLFDRGALYPWMQPKMRVDSREVVGFEALMRAHDDAGALVMPDRLIAALAEHDLLDEATMRMARQTVDFVAECLGEGMAVSASINVSMQSLTNLAFCRELAKAVEQVRLDPSWITIEITESDAMADVALVIENTARIRMLGFNLAIDDFGTAYSSLFQLSRIPFSELKIERAFMTGVDRDAGKQAIVNACAQLGNSLGLHVVAEGVETMAELAFARASGCTQVQGFLVARAMPAASALAWLRGLDELRFTLLA